MKVRVFYPNKENKIVFTKEQLEKLLSEVYNEGRADGYSSGYAAAHPVSITYPFTPYWYNASSSEIDVVPTITCTADPLTQSTTTSTSGYIMTVNQGDHVKAVCIGDEK